MQTCLLSPCSLPTSTLVLRGTICVKDVKDFYLTTPLSLGQMPKDGKNQAFSRQIKTIPSKAGTLISHLQRLIQCLL